MTFIQLGSDECQYLLDLIEEMDSDTKQTERQRGYTVPKLQKIQKDPASARLAYQDVDYLIELMEDDDLEEFEQIRGMALQTITEIQNLQKVKFAELSAWESAREMRKNRRRGVSPIEASVEVLQEKFQHVS